MRFHRFSVGHLAVTQSKDKVARSKAASGEPAAAAAAVAEVVAVTVSSEVPLDVSLEALVTPAAVTAMDVAP